MKWLVLLISICCLSKEISGESFTSSYVRLDPPSTDIPLDSPIFDPPKAHNAPQQVTLSLVFLCFSIINGTLNI